MIEARAAARICAAPRRWFGCAWRRAARTCKSECRAGRGVCAAAVLLAWPDVHKKLGRSYCVRFVTQRQPTLHTLMRKQTKNRHPPLCSTRTTHRCRCATHMTMQLPCAHRPELRPDTDQSIYLSIIIKRLSSHKQKRDIITDAENSRHNAHAVGFTMPRPYGQMRVAAHDAGPHAGTCSSAASPPQSLAHTAQGTRCNSPRACAVSCPPASLKQARVRAVQASSPHPACGCLLAGAAAC